MNDLTGADVSQEELARKLGTGQQESRSGHFAAGIMSHAVASPSIGSDGLAEAQARYAQIVPREYQRRGIQQMAANAPSALQAGISASSPRTYTWAGQRYVMGTGLGRSQATYDANPLAGTVSD
jgi:hypothetical protein